MKIFDHVKSEKEQTYWNGEPCDAKRVKVIIPKAEKRSYWYASLEGQVRRAVRVTQGGYTFLIDNEDGLGWAKVTVGMGGPHYGHSSLPANSQEVL